MDDPLRDEDLCRMLSTYSLFEHRDPADDVAIGDDGALTVGDLLADAAAVSAELPQVGEILVACTDSYHFLVSLLACWRSGVAAALPPSSHPLTVARVAADGPVLH